MRVALIGFLVLAAIKALIHQWDAAAMLVTLAFVFGLIQWRVKD